MAGRGVCFFPSDFHPPTVQSTKLSCIITSTATSKRRKVTHPTTVLPPVVLNREWMEKAIMRP